MSDFKKLIPGPAGTHASGANNSGSGTTQPIQNAGGVLGLYQGQRVSQQYLQLWRKGGSVGPAHPDPSAGGELTLSRSYVGAARRYCYVFIRRGAMVRSYHPHAVSRGGVAKTPGVGLPGGRAGQPWWYADWKPLTPWTPVSNMQHVTIAQNFTNNGVATCNIDIDNLAYTEQNKGLGLFHLIQRGFYSPLYGYVLPGQPKRTPAMSNQWFMEMPNAQILVVWGYGTELVPAFVGLIDDLDLEAKPTTMTITARDMGGILVDQVMFGDAKDRRTDRITFVPRSDITKEEKVGGGASASTTRPGYPPREVCIVGGKSHWESGDNPSADHVEWIEVKLPKGKYRSIYVNPAYKDQDLYVGFYLEPIKESWGTFHCHWTPDGGTEQPIEEANMFVEDHVNGIPKGWWTLHNGLVKSDGDRGQWPWIKRELHTQPVGRRIDLGGELYVGDSTRLRIGVRNLYPARYQGEVDYRAGITRLCAYKEVPPPKGKKLADDQIPIDDVSEIVELACQWAGFKEWEIERAGVTLSKPLVVDITTTFISLINQVRDQLGFVFFIGEPTPDVPDSAGHNKITLPVNGQDVTVPVTESLGVPIFRNTRILENTQQNYEIVTERDLLEDMKLKYSNTAERSIIRARGNLLAKKKGGQKLATDPSFRAMYTYVPAMANRMSGVEKPLTHYDPKYETVTDCQFACYLIALQVCLQVWTAQILVPGTSHVGLDSFIQVADTQTGNDGRLYVADRSITFTFGDTAAGGSSGGGASGGAFSTTLGGALPDTPDVLAVVADWINAIKSIDRNDR